MRVTIYTRVSEARDAATRKGADGETSTARQLETCKKFAEMRWPGATVTHHRDSGISAYKNVERPGWTKVVGDVEHKRTDLVLVFALDRAGRNVVRLMTFVETCREHGVAFASATQPIDTTSEWGDIVLAILAVLAQMESRIKKERALSKAREKQSAGEQTGGPKGFGYTVSMEQVPAEADAIRRATALLFNGATMQTVVDDWNSAGLRTGSGNPWTPSTVRGTLQRPTLVGLYAGSAGERGGWDAILSRNDWDRLQGIFANRRTGARHDTHLLTGLLRCGLCDGTLSGRGAKYICRATGRVHLTVVCPQLDAFVAAAAARMHAEPETVVDLSSVTAADRARIADIEAAQAKLVADTTLDPKFADRRYRALDVERAALLVAIEKTAGSYDYLGQDPGMNLRGALEQAVEFVTVKPGRGSLAERVDVTWRDGVVPNVTAEDLAWVAKERSDGR